MIRSLGRSKLKGRRDEVEIYELIRKSEIRA
jgi:hypothetical protein